MFQRLRSEALSREEQKRLLKLARDAIEANLSGASSPPQMVEPSPRLKDERGAFVTLTKDADLRGCIGVLESTQPLYQTIQEAAKAAAFKDPRFPPLTIEELKGVNIEISVLSPLRRITSTRKIKVRRHGLFIKHGAVQGLLLPQVATQNKWNRKTFLERVCLKAGLQRDAWKMPQTEIMIFDAQVFKEDSLTEN